MLLNQLQGTVPSLNRWQLLWWSGKPLRCMVLKVHVCWQNPATIPSSQTSSFHSTIYTLFQKTHFITVPLFMSTSPMCPLYLEFPDWCCTYILISFSMMFSAHLTTFILLSRCISNVHTFLAVLPSCEGIRPVIAQPLSLQVATLPVRKTYNDFERGN